MNLEMCFLISMKNCMSLDIISSFNCEESNKIKQFGLVTLLWEKLLLLSVLLVINTMEFDTISLY